MISAESKTSWVTSVSGGENLRLNGEVGMSPFCGEGAAVRVTCAFGSPVMLEMDRAIPLALIVSELITNALRHAYAGKQEGDVHVTAGAEGNDLVLTVRDFGVGFDGATRRPGFGSRVTSSLATKIGCTLQTHSRPGEGTCVTVQLRAGGPVDSPNVPSLGDDVTENAPQATG